MAKTFNIWLNEGPSKPSVGECYGTIKIQLRYMCTCIRVRLYSKVSIIMLESVVHKQSQTLLSKRFKIAVPVCIINLQALNLSLHTW